MNLDGAGRVFLLAACGFALEWRRANAKPQAEYEMCKRVHYWGTVQGVGFRMTARRVASQFAVTGYVRNLPDGKVELVVCGEAAEIDEFLGALAARMAPYIQGHKIEDEPDQTFSGFEIRI